MKYLAEYIKNKNDIENSNIVYYFNKFTKLKNPKIPKIEIDESLKYNWDISQKFLDELFEINNLKEDKILNIIKNDYHHFQSNVFIKLVKGDITEMEVIKCYKYYTNELPHSQSILLCSKYTRISEAKAFIMRYIFCKHKALF